MSAHRSWHLWCDGCDRGSPNPDHSNTTAQSARIEARRQGWVMRCGGTDWCPDCQADGTMRASLAKEADRG